MPEDLPTLRSPSPFQVTCGRIVQPADPRIDGQRYTANCVFEVNASRKVPGQNILALVRVSPQSLLSMPTARPSPSYPVLEMNDPCSLRRGGHLQDWRG